MKKTYEEEDDLKELLDLEFLREAQLLEESLLSEDDLDELNISDDDIHTSFDHLMQRLKDEGVYREDGVSAYADGEKHRKKRDTHTADGSRISAYPNARKRSWSFGKTAGFVAVILLSVFAGSMTSEANRQYLIKQIRYLRGDNSAIVADNDDSIDWPVDNEKEAIKKIEAELEVEIPEFYYRPFLLEYISFFVDKKGGYAIIWYMNSENRTNVSLTIYNRTENKSSFIINNHGEKKVILTNQDIEISFREISNAKSETEYDATWVYKDALYNFRGRIEQREFEQIVKSMQYDM